MNSRGVLAIAVLVFAACSGASHHALAPSTTLASRGQTTVTTQLRRVSVSSTTSGSSTLGLSAEERAARNHPPKAMAFPNMTGVIDPKAITHHSGGPYLTARKAADIVLKGDDCRLGGSAGKDPNTKCAQVDVRFFDHYANFWAVEGGQTEFVGSWGPDREMYVVTIFGKLPFVTTAMNQTGPEYTPDRTYQIDATTGRVLMSGGYPLPEGFPGVATFRAP